MQTLGLVRAKCYLILQGLERSLADNLVHNYDLDSPDFLTTEEQDRALYRLREDMEEPEWDLDDLQTQDLLAYLDLGDLIGLLSRHKSKVRNARQVDIEAAGRVIQERALPAIRKRVMHPVRPLEADDLSTLMAIGMRLESEAPSLIWGLLQMAYAWRRIVNNCSRSPFPHSGQRIQEFSITCRLQSLTIQGSSVEEMNARN